MALASYARARRRPDPPPHPLPRAALEPLCEAWRRRIGRTCTPVGVPDGCRPWALLYFLRSAGRSSRAEHSGVGVGTCANFSASRCFAAVDARPPPAATTYAPRTATITSHLLTLFPCVHADVHDGRRLRLGRLGGVSSTHSDGGQLASEPIHHPRGARHGRRQRLRHAVDALQGGRQIQRLHHLVKLMLLHACATTASSIFPRRDCTSRSCSTRSTQRTSRLRRRCLRR